MFLWDALVLTRRLSSPAVVRRGAVFAGLVLGERLLVTASAWALFGGSLVEKVALAVALGAFFGARTFVQHAFKIRSEAETLERVVSSIIQGDVLRVNVLPDEDARAELVQAVYLATQSVSVELPRLLADVIAALLLTVVIAAHEPARLTWLALAMMLLAAATLLATRRAMEKAIAAAWTAQHDVFVGLVDALEGRLDIVASGRRSAFLAKVRSLSGAWATAGVHVAAETLVSNKLPLLAIAGAIAVVASIVGHPLLTAATADVALLASVAPAFSGIAQGVFALSRGERWMRLVATALDQKKERAEGRLSPPRLPTRISFEDVSFSYEGAPSRALSDVSFDWEANEVLALVGTNGSGKSTCLRLLLALAPPQAGALLVGGERLNEVDPDSWRASLAFLSQRPYLPPRSTIRTAVHFLAPEAPDERIRQALFRVGILAALTRANADPLAVSVDALSVGERQRVALARLLCQDASLVLMDEPDANLDRAGIALVAGLVRELARDRMVALAAHTTELLEVAGRVVVLDGGRVIRDARSVRLVFP